MITNCNSTANLVTVDDCGLCTLPSLSSFQGLTKPFSIFFRPFAIKKSKSSALAIFLELGSDESRRCEGSKIANTCVWPKLYICAAKSEFLQSSTRLFEEETHNSQEPRHLKFQLRNILLSSSQDWRQKNIGLRSHAEVN